MTGFILKIIAVVTMILDHIKYGVPVTNCFITKYFGRISFPIFAFLISEGFVYTKNRKKYFLRMLIFACISQIPFMLFRSLVADKFLLNIMFTFLLAIAGMCIVEFFKENNSIPKFISFLISIFTLIIILIIGTAIPVDYGWFGVMTVWIFYLFRNNKLSRTLVYALEVVVYFMYKNAFIVSQINWLSLIFTIIPGIIILFYNGQQGKKLKYFFYWFYPIHMLIIYFISLI